MTDKEKKALKLIKYVEGHNKYYSDLFKKEGIDTDDINSFYKIPILKKKTIQTEYINMISDEYNIDDLFVQKTSGSSGIPLRCYYDITEKTRRGITLWNNRKSNCPDIFGKKMVSFHTGGRKITDSDISIEKDVMYLNYIGKDGLNDEKLKRFRNAISDFQPFFIRALPSVLIRFIDFCRNNNEILPCESVRYIELVGEYLTEKNYKRICDAFPDAAVRNFYGSQEFYTIGYSCKCNNLHIDDDVLVEISDPDQDGYGRIIVTGLRNNCMPFIRYEIGDTGRIVTEPCACGNTRNIIELKSSRQSEFFKVDGKTYSGDIFKLCIDNYEKMSDRVMVNQFQIYQNDVNKFEMRVISANEKEYLNDLKSFVLNELVEKYDLHIDLNVVEKTKLELNDKTNKFKMYNFLKYD